MFEKGARRVKPLLLLLAISLVLPSAVPLALFPTIVPIHGSSSPIAAFTDTPCVPCAVPGDLVSFQGNWSLSREGTIVSYTWNFGDRTPEEKTTSPFVSHDYYGYPGQWLASLTVADSNGLTDIISQLVIFYVIPRFAYSPSKPTTMEPVIFNASSSISYNTTSPITGYMWSFGDGATGTGKLAIHAYSSSGPYRVALTLQTASGDPSISQTIIVGQIDSQGGQILANDKLGLLLPYLGIGSIFAGVSTGAFFIRRRNNTSRQQKTQSIEKDPGLGAY